MPLDWKLPSSQGVTIVSALLILMLMAATPVMAHKVNVFAWVEGGTVYVESYFSGGKKAKNSLIEVFDRSGAKLLEGRTNEQGLFSFEAPEKTDLRIVLTASMGHKNDYFLTAADFGGMEPPPSPSSPEPAENTVVSSLVERDMEQLEAMIDKALERKLAPVVKLINDTRRQGPTFTEILGGIGYIFGLVGVAIYFNSRKKRKQRAGEELNA
jgi:nickel transport protein